MEKELAREGDGAELIGGATVRARHRAIASA
jgi:hypothetical protein